MTDRYKCLQCSLMTILPARSPVLLRRNRSCASLCAAAGLRRGAGRGVRSGGVQAAMRKGGGEGGGGERWQQTLRATWGKGRRASAYVRDACAIDDRPGAEHGDDRRAQHYARLGRTRRRVVRVMPVRGERICKSNPTSLKLIRRV